MMRLHVLNFDPSDLPADFWSSRSSELLIMGTWAKSHPKELERLRNALPHLPSHVWIASSGTLAKEGFSKWVALSKEALLTSAEGVNRHLRIHSSEVWGLTLPLAHVGGLGILARAQLLNQQVVPLIEDRWRPAFVSQGNWKGHLLSLVPTQVHDLVENKITPPPTLRAVVVGGDRLDEHLAQKAIALGWNILPSYGLTECASQVATAVDPGGALKLLPHVTVTFDGEQRIHIKSPSLFTGVALITPEGHEWTPRMENPWPSQDRGEMDDEALRLLGRIDSFIKVRGEKVDLNYLQSELEKKWGAPFVVESFEHERDGLQLWGISKRQVKLEEINANLLPHEKLKGILVVDEFPRNPLGKIKRAQLREWILKSGA